jgi:hypothetical protein
VKYEFIQPFEVSAQEAFDWCTDYKPFDLALMKEKGVRRIRKITKDAVLLTETTMKNRQAVRKTKLLRLSRAQLSWTNTHIAGANRHSQFLYRIVSEGRRKSQLSFVGLLIVYSREALDARALRQIAERERQADSRAWRFLGAAMSNDLRGTQ